MSADGLPGGLIIRRQPIAAVWGGYVSSAIPPSGTVQPPVTAPVRRRIPARVIWRGSLVSTTNRQPVAVPAPLQRLIVPRRAAARAVWAGTITEGANATHISRVLLGTGGSRWKWTADGARI
jgi:hypothetical protein